MIQPMKLDSQISIIDIKSYLMRLQDLICKNLEKEEAKQKFIEDQWLPTHGGLGRTRVLSEGDIIERAGVNFSHIHGIELPPTATLKRPQLAGANFQALGVSVVIHPRNPLIPTTHFNVRFFIAEKKRSRRYGGLEEVMI